MKPLLMLDWKHMLVHRLDMMCDKNIWNATTTVLYTPVVVAAPQIIIEGQLNAKD